MISYHWKPTGELLKQEGLLGEKMTYSEVEIAASSISSNILKSVDTFHS